MKMDMKDADMTLWTEAEFEEKCTYIVNDQPADPSTEDCSITQAESSLPRNLIFKYAGSGKEVRRVSPHMIWSWKPNGITLESGNILFICPVFLYA